MERRASRKMNKLMTTSPLTNAALSLQALQDLTQRQRRRRSSHSSVSAAAVLQLMGVRDKKSRIQQKSLDSEVNIRTMAQEVQTAVIWVSPSSLTLSPPHLPLHILFFREPRVIPLPPRSSARSWWWAKLHGQSSLLPQTQKCSYTSKVEWGPLSVFMGRT